MPPTWFYSVSSSSISRTGMLKRSTRRYALGISKQPNRLVLPKQCLDTNCQPIGGVDTVRRLGTGVTLVDWFIE